MNFNPLTIPDFLSQLPSDLAMVRPELLIFIIMLFLLLFGKSPSFSNALTLFVSIILFSISVYLYFVDFYVLEEKTNLFSEMLVYDRLGLVFRILFSFSGAITLWLYTIVKKEEPTLVFTVLILAVILGLNLLVMSNHWAMAFLSLETVSISSYLLISLEKQSIRAEAGIKYLLFGAASSAVMLYGISWIYGIQGNLSINLPNATNPILGIIIILIFSGLLFKTAAFPFHFWSPDVYEGTPGYLLPFLSYAPKVGAFILISRLTIDNILDSSILLPFLALISIGSLMVGNWGALRQDHSLRLMAFSGIAQVGFVLSGISCGNIGFESTIFYLIIYLFMNFSVISVLYIIGYKTGSYSIKSLYGFGQYNPLISTILVVGLVALAGLPPTIGFSGKVLIFSSLWESYTQTKNQIFIALLVSSGLFTLTSFYFYLKIPYYLFVKKNETNLAVNLFFKEKLVILVLTLPLLLLFFMPQKLNNFVKLINLVY